MGGNPCYYPALREAQLLFAYWRFVVNVPVTAIVLCRERASAATAVLGKFLRIEIASLSSRSFSYFARLLQLTGILSSSASCACRLSALRFLRFSMNVFLNSINSSSSSDRIVHFPSRMCLVKKRRASMSSSPSSGSQSIISGRWLSRSSKRASSSRIARMNAVNGGALCSVVTLSMFEICVFR